MKLLMKKRKFTLPTWIALATLGLAACSDDNVSTPPHGGDDYAYVGKAVGNFTAAEWYPGGKLGTTENVGHSSYEDETPAVTAQGLDESFKFGEAFFERNYNEGTPPFNGLGPAWIRSSCQSCHPGYGHGKRQTSYQANTFGNGYLLVVYDKDTKAYVPELTGMPQTKASSPFLPPIDESGIHIDWLVASDGALPTTFPDGETYELIYPEVTIDLDAFHTDPKPSNYEVRLESTIGIYGTGLIDAITEDDLKAQYQAEARLGLPLNPAMWDSVANDWAATAWYSGYPANATDRRPRIKRYTYALSRATLQDGPGANAIWNITNVSRSDRPKLYTTDAWAKAMSENENVLTAIAADPESPYYADGSREGIAERILTLLSPNTDQFAEGATPEMSDRNYYELMVWHRGLAVPRARNLNDPQVQRGKTLFYEMGCTTCHRPSWTTGDDDYWADEVVKSQGKLPVYKQQVIWPYSDFVQHRLFMKNDIRADWCRTTPLWGRGLSLQNTGAEDRLHDCRARNEIEAIMWHGYSRKSEAFGSAEKFYNLPKTDRDAVVAFIRAI